MPDLQPPPSIDEARKALQGDPKSAEKHVKLALALLAEGNEGEALSTLQLALQLDPSEPTALFIQLKLHMAKKELDAAKKIADQLIRAGHDGYAVRMKAADIAEAKKDLDGMRAHLFRAFELDPSQAEPLQALHDLALKRKDEQEQLFALRQLAKLDQHDRRVWLRLLSLLIARGHWEEARSVGEAALYIDVLNPELHFLYARALARTGRHVSAIFELNSAIKARPEPATAVKIYRMMAEGYRKLGKAEFATKAEQFAERVQTATTK